MQTPSLARWLVVCLCCACGTAIAAVTTNAHAASAAHVASAAWRVAPVPVPATATGDVPVATETVAVDPLQRVAVLGASVMAGFGLAHEVGRPVLYSHVVDAMLRGERRPVASFASDRLFMMSLAQREALVTRLVEHRPSLVLAVDFLFWYGYGVVFDEESRPLLFERGLQELQRLGCPVVVGDLPDVSSAVGRATYMGTTLVDVQVPSAAMLARLNARLHEWAREQPHVIVLPLADFVRRTLADEPFVLRGTVIEGARDDILQSDWLHPTLLGSAALTAFVLDAVEQALGDGFDETRVDWDAASVVQRLDPRPEAVRPEEPER